ncbi:unnamed protein product [Rotaria sp. Silwood1]|nr:unnamed protein product [Rotaria sp. Silwood1]
MVIYSIASNCKCRAVSNTVHFPFHKWDVSSCKFCSCQDASMVNCEQACKALVESYALTGCGKVLKGSKVKYAWDASSCSSVHFPFHKWDVSSCKFCSCQDASMVNCEQACKALVESYALTGCGKVLKGSKVKYAWDASSCSSGISNDELTCA